MTESRELICLFYLENKTFEFHVIPASTDYKTPDSFNYHKGKDMIVWSVVFNEGDYKDACKNMWMKVRVSFNSISYNLERDLKKRFLNEEESKQLDAFIENVQKDNPI
jgi:hypothetical protein